MKPSKALEQLRRCALGYCDSCVHSDENCRDRIEKMVNLLGTRLILADYAEKLTTKE